MDNKQFPEQELPEESIPVSMEPLMPEDMPQEPLFVREPVAQALPIEPEFPASMEEFSAQAKLSAPEEALVETDELAAAAEEAAAEERPSPSNGSDFMSRIPDVEEDYPEPASEPILPVPDDLPEIIPDAQAAPEQEEEASELDMSFLNESLFAAEEPMPTKEELTDQEYRDNGKDFDALYNTPAAEKEDSFLPRPPRKGRPKRKKGEGLLGIPSILVTVVWLALIVAIGVTLGRMLWVCAADVLAFGREDKAVTITVYEADTMDDIVDKLYDAGLIRYKSLFNLYADISDAEEDIQPGIYDLNTRYDYHALVNFMSPRSSRDVVEGVMIPEGYTCQQIFELLEENKVCTAVDIAAYAANGELGDYWFLEGIERGSENCLEGFLFPDTYDFYKNSSPKEVLTKLLDNFENKFSEDMRTQLAELNSELTGDYTVREIVIVASLIEKESAAPAESPSIAGVIYNRLFNWNYPAFLNIDAAIVYAQGGNADTIDTKLDSPYNTYTNIGLTPGPISNPGLASLKAALNPESHNYYYYVLNPSTGMHQFSTTEAEHNAYVADFYG